MDFAIKYIAGVVLLASAVAPAPLVSQETAAAEHISLTDAIRRAEANEPLFAAALAAERAANIDRYLAKAALLPSAIYHNQVLYTQPNGLVNQVGQVGAQAAPIFIANNTVHEYSSQATINETIGLKQFAAVEVASATAARIAAELEVARRGLRSAVVSLYFTVSVSEAKRRLLTEALVEAQTFTNMTQKREAVREVAHADVVKAQLQQQQKQRDLSDAVVAANRARLELAVLLFPDPRTPYSTDAPSAPGVLATREEINRLASTNNPEIRSALADIRLANAEVKVAKAAYLPDLALNFTYGIDAPQFAKHGPDGVRNLGYSISGTLDVPVWDWFSTEKRIKQSQIRREAVKISLTAAQRRLIANIEEGYTEAVAARDQMDLLDLSVRTAAESLRLTKLRYTAGESTALEVVDAQNTFLSVATAQADGVVRLEAALSALQILTGTL